nr:TIM barrel protein [Sporohalobacter salinus]
MHLSYYLNWLPSTSNKNDKLNLDEIITDYKEELSLAEQLDVDYVVFHASSLKPENIFTENFAKSNSIILSEVAEVINKVMDGLEVEFKLLFENLWWGGLTFLDRSEALEFIRQVAYENVGFLVDTGHLMNTNVELSTEVEALCYLKNVLMDFKDIADLFYGVHLHKSHSGSYRQKNHAVLHNEFKSTNRYEEKTEIVGEFISNIDQHLPFSHVSPRGILELIEPKYLTHEFTCYKKERFIEFLEIQKNIL